jgi:transcription elongation factor GreA
MSSDRVWLTREGRDRLMQELHVLKTVKRRELSKAIGAAIEMGDISENAEYDAAKNEQGLLEKRIAGLEDQLARSVAVDDYDVDTKGAVMGCTVRLQDLNRDRELTYVLVGEIEADFSTGRISVTSPVGKAILGKEVGDAVEAQVPAGTLRFKVLEVTR